MGLEEYERYSIEVKAIAGSRKELLDIKDEETEEDGKRNRQHLKRVTFLKCQAWHCDIIQKFKIARNIYRIFRAK